MDHYGTKRVVTQGSPNGWGNTNQITAYLNNIKKIGSNSP